MFFPADPRKTGSTSYFNSTPLPDFKRKKLPLSSSKKKRKRSSTNANCTLIEEISLSSSKKDVFKSLKNVKNGMKMLKKHRREHNLTRVKSD